MLKRQTLQIQKWDFLLKKKQLQFDNLSPLLKFYIYQVRINIKQYNENELRKEINVRRLSDKNVFYEEKLCIKWLYLQDIVNEIDDVTS